MSLPALPDVLLTVPSTALPLLLLPPLERRHSFAPWTAPPLPAPATWTEQRRRRWWLGWLRLSSASQQRRRGSSSGSRRRPSPPAACSRRPTASWAWVCGWGWGVVGGGGRRRCELTETGITVVGLRGRQAVGPQAPTCPHPLDLHAACRRRPHHVPRPGAVRVRWVGWLLATGMRQGCDSRGGGSGARPLEASSSPQLPWLHRTGTRAPDLPPSASPGRRKALPETSQPASACPRRPHHVHAHRRRQPGTLGGEGPASRGGGARGQPLPVLGVGAADGGRMPPSRLTPLALALRRSNPASVYGPSQPACSDRSWPALCLPACPCAPFPTPAGPVWQGVRAVEAPGLQDEDKERTGAAAAGALPLHASGPGPRPSPTPSTTTAAAAAAAGGARGHPTHRSPADPGAAGRCALGAQRWVYTQRGVHAWSVHVWGARKGGACAPVGFLLSGRQQGCTRGGDETMWMCFNCTCTHSQALGTGQASRVRMAPAAPPLLALCSTRGGGPSGEAVRPDPQPGTGLPGAWWAPVAGHTCLGLCTLAAALDVTAQYPSVPPLAGRGGRVDGRCSPPTHPPTTTIRPGLPTRPTHPCTLHRCPPPASTCCLPTSAAAMEPWCCGPQPAGWPLLAT